MKILFRHKTFMYFSRKALGILAFEYFISKKTLKSVVQGKKVSKPIVRISIISIALAVIVNLITIAVVTGFQQEVRQKVTGFGSHIFIMEAGENSVFESAPIRRDQAFLATLKNDPGIASVNVVGYKPVLFQSDERETTYTLPNGQDTTEFQYQVHGAVIKGVDSTFDWKFFKKHLLEGVIPDFREDSCSNHIVISKRLSKDLNFKIGDRISAFFVKNNPVKWKFKIAGIYETGLEEFDKQIVLGDLGSVQELNDWGIQVSLEIADTIIDEQIVIKANASGGNGNLRYNFGNGFDSYYGFALCPNKDTLIRVIVSDYWSDISAPISETTLPDTAYLKITVEGDLTSRCVFKLNEFDELDREYLSEDGRKFAITDGAKRVTCELREGTGSSHNYVGGFEITVKKWDDLEAVMARVKGEVHMIPTPFGELVKSTSIMENQPDIFMWLGFLDINVIIILTLMILIGIINMGSALLVLILIRTNFIGMMKAMGATNWSIRKIFLYQAAFLIGRGMIWGNIIGVALCLIQQSTGIISLNPEVYYLTQVPIELNFWHWLILNAATLVVCLSALIVPSIVITKINPVKAIKFD
ncbi:MAG: lipoprotein-releasing system permease protein [Flavobacteriaceae bacterium]|jgi:lipoprotein-releasing system permease protein